jgi:hypothetical protein
MIQPWSVGDRERFGSETGLAGHLGVTHQEYLELSRGSASLSRPFGSGWSRCTGGRLDS